MNAGLTLDAGALIAFESGDRSVIAIMARARLHKLRLAVPAEIGRAHV